MQPKVAIAMGCGSSIHPVEPECTEEDAFAQYRAQITGIDAEFESPFGSKKIVYTDWIASGRLYNPIETTMSHRFGPFVANTHTESTVTGETMTQAYKHAHQIIKKHVNACERDAIITLGSGMTAAVCKLQRMMGLVVPQRFKQTVLDTLDPNDVPIVFVTHLEHHSNEVSWRESIVEVVELPPTSRGLVDPDALRKLLEETYKNRSTIIGSFSHCSNVTGIFSPIHELAQVLHEYGGYCFVDFACSAPYVDINMHPQAPGAHLDAIFFSPHKFLGGPGSSGVLVFNTGLPGLQKVPDHPGGGTVSWTNPWRGHQYVESIEAREDGGTPGFLQGIKAALAVQLKEEIGTARMKAQEEKLMAVALPLLKQIDGLVILGDLECERLPIISFYVRGIHFNLIVKLLNDRFGIQARGGCACAGPYGHHLLGIDPQHSKAITDEIDRGDSSKKPGWVRFALHPTMALHECTFVVAAIKDVVMHAKEWEKDYIFDPGCGEYTHKTVVAALKEEKKEENCAEEMGAATREKQLASKGKHRRRSLAIFASSFEVDDNPSSLQAE